MVTTKYGLIPFPHDLSMEARPFKILGFVADHEYGVAACIEYLDVSQPDDPDSYDYAIRYGIHGKTPHDLHDDGWKIYSVSVKDDFTIVFIMRRLRGWHSIQKNRNSAKKIV